MVTTCTASLPFTNSTFCPHSVFMCFVWISEQTAIISLYTINWLVCITETECVYCAVRAEWWNISRVNFHLQRVTWIKNVLELKLFYLVVLLHFPRAQNGRRKDFFLACDVHWFQNFYFYFFCFPDRCLCIVKNTCLCTHIWLRTDCMWITVAAK